MILFNYTIDQKRYPFAYWTKERSDGYDEQIFSLYTQLKVEIRNKRIFEKEYLNDFI
jgi:hypothetical protein